MTTLPDEFLTAEEIATALKVSARTVERWERDGKFPKGFLISPREKRWLKSDFLWWVECRRRPPLKPMEPGDLPDK